MRTRRRTPSSRSPTRSACSRSIPTRSEAYEPLILALLGLEQARGGQRRARRGRQALVEARRRESASPGTARPRRSSIEESGGPERARETWSRCLRGTPDGPGRRARTRCSSTTSKGSRIARSRSCGRRSRALRSLRTFRGDAGAAAVLGGTTAGAEALLLEATKPEDPGSPSAPGSISASSVRRWTSTRPPRTRWSKPSRC